ncbi:hypothetical protein [Phytopseudomonas dryadis]|uniref:DUF3887 domain-containing protein n=1 Tax=Phytopseudomonas dryadis TaxID=2487520 RepID=A0A4Q9R3N6_9GAMM|nr:MULTISPECIES: hypothetical protein [Pseudomonas]TBU92695.1 hypothetical protein DNK44_11525 [Pseudomonas dryadis]TBV00607.1 hypothetical protein DNK34_23220 [Pseudomonas dryadis]TBV14481.1 hypothetical protein DNK41_19920 [Pseudomonas sp. FRB 230]
MKTAILFCLVFLAACASSSGAGRTLFELYEDYVQATNAGNVALLAPRYFSPRLIEGKNLDSPGIKSQLLFKERMVTIRNHLERKMPAGGCLTINGHDEERMPIAFDIAYSRGDNSYLISQVAVSYLNDEADFSDTARCPDEPDSTAH